MKNNSNLRKFLTENKGTSNKNSRVYSIRRRLLSEIFGRAKSHADWYKDTFSWANKEEKEYIDDLIDKKGAQKVADMAKSRKFKGWVKDKALEKEMKAKINDPKNLADFPKNLKEISEGSKNFDLKKFLTENKLTSNSRKLNENEEPDYYPNKEVQIFTYDDWEKTLATAYEKDGSTEVTVYDEGDDGDLKKLIPIDIDSFIDMLKSKGGVGHIATNAHPNNITASAVKPELLWKFLESLGFNFDKWTVK